MNFGRLRNAPRPRTTNAAYSPAASITGTCLGFSIALAQGVLPRAPCLGLRAHMTKFTSGKNASNSVV